MTQNPERIDHEELTILDLIEYFLKNKETIIKFTFYGFIISLIISLVLPKTYLSKGIILPSIINQSSSSQLAIQISALTGTSPSIFGIKDPLSLYEDFLKTNFVIDYVIEKNNLEKRYPKKEKEDIRKAVKKSIYTKQNKKSGTIEIGYFDKNPKLAYDITISLIEGLKKLNNKLAITDASQRRLFYEEQLKSIRETLIELENKLQNFQLKTGSVKIDEEAKSQIEQASQLKAKISAKEIELKILSSYATKNSPEYKQLSDEINALKEQLAKIQNKLPVEDNSIASVKLYSKYGIEFIRLTREYKFNETLYEMLLKQYELAKLDESKDISLIQIVDEPEIPTQKEKPKRIIIVLVSTFIAFIFSFIFVLIKTTFQNEQEKLKKIKEELMQIKYFVINLFKLIKKF
ncbi:MAG: GNVR domain-containing protein [Nitrososphaerota archaeon]